MSNIEKLFDKMDRLEELIFGDLASDKVDNRKYTEHLKNEGIEDYI